MQLKPKFDDLKNPQTLIDHLDEIKKEAEAKHNLFPVDVFPEAIQEIVTATNESLNYPIDFIGASILYAISVSIGNTHKVELKNDWQEPAVIYLAIVGPAGTNKSHPVKFAIKPIEEMDSHKYQKYLNAKKEFDTISALTKKEREQQGYSEPVKPIWEQYLVSDFTPEALTDVLKFNNRGIGVYADELASWFKNFNRYNKGSEEQFWLSVWSGTTVRVNRKTTEHVYITKPFIPVIGTIQPRVLNELADNRTENGFLDRVLFAFPKNTEKPYWSEIELDSRISKNWQTVISTLLSLPISHDGDNNPQPKILKFTAEAKQLLFKWQRELTDESNAPGNDALRGINAKVEVYAIRFALILQMTMYACNVEDKQAIGIEAVKGALKLTKYFKRTAQMVHSIVHNANPLDKLPEDKQTLYSQLPETFTTGEGWAVANSLGMAERTFKNFLNRRDLLKKPKRGEYEKLF